MKKDCYGVSSGESSFIGVDSNNNFIKFGKIGKEFSFDYRQDKNNEKFFQQQLNFDGFCNIDNIDDNDDYYNIRYIYKCNNNLKEKSPIIYLEEDKEDKCKFIVYISLKELCDYTPLSYDKYINKFKIFICIISAISSIIFLYPTKKNYIAFSVSLYIALNIIFFIIIFNFSVNFWIIFAIQIILINLIIILMLSINFRSKKKKILDFIFFIAFYTVSGFLFGDILVEIITLYVTILSNIGRWLIILGFSIVFNFFLFFDKYGFIICSSFSCSYFITNIALILTKNKIPVNTIINTFKKDGFDIEYMKHFRNPNIYKYFITYFCLFSLNLICKVIWLYFTRE